MVEILFVHGALVRDGAWWWRQVAERIHEQTGTASRAVELPSCGEGAPPGTAGLLEDARALRDALNDVDEAVVVGHSYGGGSICVAGVVPRTTRPLVIWSTSPRTCQTSGSRKPTS